MRSLLAVRPAPHSNRAVPDQTAVRRTFSLEDQRLFGALSGDTNPLHLHDDFARGTMFKGRIAHGMLSASFISTVVGTKLPGPGAVYVSQTLNFRAPVHVGDVRQDGD